MVFVIRTTGYISAICLMLLFCSTIQAMRFVYYMADFIASVNNVKATVESLGFTPGEPVVPTEKYLLNRMLWGAKTVQEVQHLIAQKADVNSDDNEKDTALHYAAFAGNSLVVAELLKGKAYVEAYSDENGTPLMVAATRGYWDIVTMLVAAGANPFIKEDTIVTELTNIFDEDSVKKMEVAVREGMLQRMVVGKLEEDT